MGEATNHMTASATRAWEAKRTTETRWIEAVLNSGFDQADAYRYNSASIRLRVIDRRFEGIPREKRDAMVEEQIGTFPPETQRDIVTLFTFAPSELSGSPKNFREFMLNTEFDDPSPSML